MKGIYSFFWDCRRMGSLEGTFIADSMDVVKVIGKEVYFGEVLGKHSEVYGTLNEGDITLITQDQDFISKFEEIMGEGWGSGFNPIEQWFDRNEDDETEEDENE